MSGKENLKVHHGIENQEVDKHLKRKGFIYAIFASSIYAFNSILGKMIMVEGAEPLVVNFFQYLMSVVIIFGTILVVSKDKFKINRRQIKQTMIQGVIGAFGTSAFFYLALKHLNAGIASMLLFTNPVFITIFFAITGMKKLKKVNYIALLLAMTGIVLVLDVFSVRGTELSLIGIGYGLASALTYSFYNIYADFKIAKMDHYTVLFYTSLFGLISSFGSVVGLYGTVPILSLHILKYILIIAVFAGILPVVFFYKSVAIIGSERTSIVATLELPITLMVAFLILKEHLNLMQMGGAVMVILSVYLLHRED